MKKAFTPLHPKNRSFQDVDELHAGFKSIIRPRLLGRGVTGFTLIELLTAIIIVAILAAIAIPNYFKMVERGRSAEAVTVLGALRGAQVRYYHAHQLYADSNMNFLDIEPANNKYFDFQAYDPGVTSFAGTSCEGALATAVRNADELTATGRYTLCIKTDGSFGCVDGNADDCAKLGY